MRAAAASTGDVLLVSGGWISIEVRRAACPPDQRPCGEACPFPSEATVVRHDLRPESSRFRHLCEQLYCEALLAGEAEFKPDGAVAAIQVEIEADEEGTPGAAPHPVRHLVVSVEGRSRSVSSADWSRPFLVESRNRDLVRTGRVAPLYWAEVCWSRSGNGSSRRARAGRPPVLRAGRRVRPGRFPEDWGGLVLDQPAGAGAGRPMVQVVWHDLAGLAEAGGAAVREPSRETAFLLLGRPCFCDRPRTAFTEVHRVIPVTRLEVSTAAQASLAPESLAEGKAAADAGGLDVVGVLHSHVVEAEADGAGVDGLFYSGTDIEDHALLLPSAWSIGGVLNVRADRSVQVAFFARDLQGGYAPLERLLVPPGTS